MKQVLITNNALGGLGGSECYVIDVAKNLLKRGWQPIAFSTLLGETAKALKAMGVPSVDNLDKLHRPPDLIHSHHHLDAMVAIQKFPNVPVIHFCHGWIPWQERPLVHPQILHYVAVSQLCWERLVIETGIPPEKVSTIYSFVDLDRFKLRSTPPGPLKRALMFGNSFSPKSGVTQSIRQACDHLGIELAEVGAQFGGRVANPEEILKDYDLVFAKGRCVLEGIATGCAAIVADDLGLGGLVTAERFDDFYQYNFGFRLFVRNPNPTVEHFIEELKLYSPADSQQVVSKVLEQASLSKAMARLHSIYLQVLEQASTVTFDVRACQEATAAYLLDFAHQSKHLHNLPKELQAKDLKIRKLEEAAKMQNQVLHQTQALEQKHRKEAQQLEKTTSDLKAKHEVLLKQQRDLVEAHQAQGNYLTEANTKAANLKLKLASLNEKNQKLQSQIEHLRAHSRGIYRYLPSSWVKRLIKSDTFPQAR